ncbi:Mitochondrial import receptor subunit tom20 [Cyphellophora attinorum]|uniref:Mitochondrial import receptor subunit tom20 n=1 Tax=Cyphellophora attinorum TaxID=1664694 RepID=A0A0N1H836_9EURO|nr:Mitochondrial import receptor subunit tom20 [Phialophora attinorum]KPI39395.1 Mitochondrial import receptor subunit tom20 [Phialophora attinorum]
MRPSRTVFALASSCTKAASANSGLAARLSPFQASRTAPHRQIFSSSRSRVPLSVKIRNYTAQARHDSPILFRMLLIGTFAAVTALAFVSYDEYFHQAPKFADYPPEVEQMLRLALHYTYVRPDKDAALRKFHNAVKLAEEKRMDPFGKPFIGLRIRFAEMLETFGHVKEAVENLGMLAQECEDKIEPSSGSIEQDASNERRKRMVKTVINCKNHMAELYQGEYLQDTDKAKETLSEAITLLVKESQDPKTKGLSDKNGADMSHEEIASVLNHMSTLYSATGEYDNALQTRMLTLAPLRAACDGSRTCREGHLLSNIAHDMYGALQQPNATINGQPKTDASVAAAHEAILGWLGAAQDTIQPIPLQQWNDECALGTFKVYWTMGRVYIDMGDKTRATAAFSTLLRALKQLGPEALRSIGQDHLIADTEDFLRLTDPLNTEQKLDQEIQAAVKEATEEGFPTAIEEQEKYFHQQIAHGEELAGKGSNPMQAALCFYKGLKVYSDPTSLWDIYKSTVPGEVMKIVRIMLVQDKALRGKIEDADKLDEARAASRLHENRHAK